MKKFLPFSILVTIAAVMFVSCSNDDTELQPDPDPTPKSLELRISAKVEASDDAKKMFNLSGSELVYGNQTINLEDALAASNCFEEPALKGEVPTKMYLKLNVTAKDNFSPEKGRKYNVAVTSTFCVTIIDKTTGKIVASTGDRRGGASITGVNFEKAVEEGMSVSEVLKTMKDAINYKEGFSISASGEIMHTDE